MNFDHLEKGVSDLQRLFVRGANRVLSDSAEYVLGDSLQKAQLSYDQAKRQFRANPKGNPRWVFNIHPDHPLEFIRSKEAPPFEPTVDLFCAFTGEVVDKQGTSELRSQDITVRIWSDVLDHIYRPELDSAEIGDELTRLDGKSRRIMTRWHFDFANKGTNANGKVSSAQRGPEYHLQFGGKPQRDELAWHPEALNLPRFLHTPMDLFLVVELIAANFFPTQYVEYGDEPSWHGIILGSQRLLLVPFYNRALSSINMKKSVLKSMWNREQW